jgi:hypothetical protein
MRQALVRRAASMARALVLTTTILASAASAQTPSFKSGDWGTEDGGAVVVRADGAFDLAITDSTTGDSIFSQGKVTARTPTADGKLALTLQPAQPNAKVGQFIIEVATDGSGVLFVQAGGSRHQAATLKK